MTYTLRTNKTWAQTEADIREQLRLWGAEVYSLHRPNAAQKGGRSWSETPEEAVVIVSAKWKDGREFRLEYNKQARAVDNARVLFLAIESLRLNEVRGIDDVMREAYLSLPTPAQAVRERDPYEVLGVHREMDLEDIEAVYKSKARRLHPDTSASDGEAMKALNVAWDTVKAQRSAVAS